jgi:DNA-binding HxlR family transcriptional regulator
MTTEAASGHSGGDRHSAPMDAHLTPRAAAWLETICRRWTLQVLWTLLQQPMRYNDLARAIPDISREMLTQRLHELETQGLVAREVSTDRRLGVTYRATAAAQTLGNPLKEITAWALNQDQSPVPIQRTYTGAKPPARRVRPLSDIA